MGEIGSLSRLLAWSSEGAAPYVLVLGLVLVTAALLIGIRKKRTKQANRPSGREQIERTRQHNQMRGDLEQTMVELEQLAKRLSAQLDAKTLTIEKRLAEADQRIAQLEHLAQHRPPPSQDAPGDAASSHWPLPACEYEPAPASTVDRSTPSQAPNTAETAETANTADAANAADEVNTADAADDVPDALTRSIYHLADEGHASAAIAKQVDEHIGKVELILALRKT